MYVADSMLLRLNESGIVGDWTYINEFILLHRPSAVIKRDKCKTDQHAHENYSYRRSFCNTAVGPEFPLFCLMHNSTSFIRSLA